MPPAAPVGPERWPAELMKRAKKLGLLFDIAHRDEHRSVAVLKCSGETFSPLRRDHPGHRLGTGGLVTRHSEAAAESKSS
jgi:hypothetical protein